MTSVNSVLWLFAVSLGASALGGMLGMASGVFIVPILTIFGHLDIRVAIGASLVSVIACSSGGAAQFLQGGLTNIRLAVVLEVATTLGALSGVLVAGIIPTSYLFLLFAIILLLSAQQMSLKRRVLANAPPTDVKNWSASLGLDASYIDQKEGREILY